LKFVLGDGSSFFDSLENHLEVRVVIVRTAGRGFCADVDIKNVKEVKLDGMED
jgi:enoyl-CoA hydratase/carnithine racemase